MCQMLNILTYPQFQNNVFYRFRKLSIVLTYIGTNSQNIKCLYTSSTI